MRKRYLYCERKRGPDDRLVWLMDLNIVPLVRVLNRFAGIQTLSSCGGHESPGPTQYEAGSWYIKFRVAWDEAGRASLTFLAWLINNRALKQGRNVILYPYTRTQDKTNPSGLTFILEGHGGEDPTRFATWLREERRKKQEARGT